MSTVRFAAPRRPPFPGSPSPTPGALVPELSLFADAACSEPARYGGSCLPFMWLAPECEGITTVYRASRPVDRAFERDDTGACVEVDLGSGADVWALEPMPLDAFARFERVLR